MNFAHDIKPGDQVVFTEMGLDRQGHAGAKRNLLYDVLFIQSDFDTMHRNYGKNLIYIKGHDLRTGGWPEDTRAVYINDVQKYIVNNAQAKSLLLKK